MEEKPEYGGQLVTTKTTHAVPEFTAAERQLIRDSFAPGTTDQQFELFLWTARSRGLDPRAGQIHAVVRKVRVREGNDWTERPIMTIQTGIDGYRLIAQRTGEYLGKAGPFWCGPDGVWKDVWLSDDPPAAAKVGVMRKGDVDYTWHVARWKEYVQTVDQDDGRGNRVTRPNAMWRKMDAHMLAKCAEAGALRARFPEELAGVYVDAEYNAVHTIDLANEERQLQYRRPAIARPKPKAPEPLPQPEEARVVEEEDPEAEQKAWEEFFDALLTMLEEEKATFEALHETVGISPDEEGIQHWWREHRHQGHLIPYLRRKIRMFAR